MIRLEERVVGRVDFGNLGNPVGREAALTFAISFLYFEGKKYLSYKTTLCCVLCLTCWWKVEVTTGDVSGKTRRETPLRMWALKLISDLSSVTFTSTAT